MSKIHKMEFKKKILLTIKLMIIIQIKIFLLKTIKKINLIFQDKTH